MYNCEYLKPNIRRFSSNFSEVSKKFWVLVLYSFVSRFMVLLWILGVLVPLAYKSDVSSVLYLVYIQLDPKFKISKSFTLFRENCFFENRFLDDIVVSTVNKISSKSKLAVFLTTLSFSFFLSPKVFRYKQSATEMENESNSLVRWVKSIKKAAEQLYRLFQSHCIFESPPYPWAFHWENETLPFFIICSDNSFGLGYPQNRWNP